MKKEALNVSPEVVQMGKYLGGGVLTGAGIAGLLNLIKNTKQQVKERTVDTSLDDDVLYVKGRKARSKSASTDGIERDYVPSNPTYINDSGVNKFINLALGVTGALGGYAGVRKMYKTIQEKQLQDELDDAQVAYITGLHKKRDAETKKYASIDKEALSGTGDSGSTVSAGALSALAMLALASGVISYKTLDEAFPGRRDPGEKPTGGKPIKAFKPKEVKILGRRNKVVDAVNPETGGDTDVEELENLIRTTAANPGVSKAAGFDDLISAVADNRASEIKQGLTIGIDHVFDLVKGASTKEIPEVDKELAICAIARDPMLKSAFGPLFAAEYAHMSPSFFDAAAALSDEEKNNLCKIAAGFNATYRKKVIPQYDEQIEKSASALASGFLAMNNVKGSLDEGTSFFSSGRDSTDEVRDKNDSEEDPEEVSDTDDVDSFFDNKMKNDSVE
jgi:hypothetical protein